MARTDQRQDADRHRRRLKLLAELADARSEREWSRRITGERLRELIAIRRRLTG